jgi:hypothetical protein
VQSDIGSPSAHNPDLKIPCNSSLKKLIIRIGCVTFKRKKKAAHSVCYFPEAPFSKSLGDFVGIFFKYRKIAAVTFFLY